MSNRQVQAFKDRSGNTHPTLQQAVAKDLEEALDAAMNGETDLGVLSHYMVENPLKAEILRLLGELS